MNLSDSAVLRLLTLTAPKLEDDEPEPDFPDGRWLGEYELLRLVGCGGMGRVYEARRVRAEVSVALKVMRPELVSERERRRFLDTAEQVATFKHPHIVQVLHVNANPQRPYFTMELISGAPLTRARMQSERRPAGAPNSWRVLEQPVRTEQKNLAALLAKVAAAVDYAHKRGLLHRDLKPANILIDDHGEPHIVDFGLARRIESSGHSTLPGALEGTPYYMPPEQVRGGSDGLTVAADIYSLGATLYEVLVGRPPFIGSDGEVVAQITGPEPPIPPRELAPDVHPYLEAVCLKCLEKSPARRYTTAGKLALDLRSVAAGQPPAIPPLSPWRRWVYRMRRQPARARKLLHAALALIALCTLLIYGWQSRQARVREALLANTAIASGQAVATLLQLERYANRIAEGARVPAFAQHATGGAVALDPGPELKQLSVGLDTAFVVSTEGYVRAQWPLPPFDISKNKYDFRDYFQGARALARRGDGGVYVAHAFRSERDGQMKFAVSAPIYEGGRWVGVLVGALATDSVFGEVRTLTADPERATVLLGPRDVERGELEAGVVPMVPERFVTLIHSGLQRGQEVPTQAPPELLRAFEHGSTPGAQFALDFPAPEVATKYHDPVLGFEGSWMAAFAPVGRTGYVVVAQSRDNRFW
jgi:eukaryotic-like serine/threonine-protein kinase